MAKYLLFVLSCSVLLGSSSCTRDVYKRPITISRLDFKNNADPKYEAQFHKVNNWQMLLLDSAKTMSEAFVVDTASKKKFHQLNYTLSASLRDFNSDSKSGVYYQVYMKPNNGTGILTGGGYNNMYVVLELYSPEKNFLTHGFKFYRDSVLTGSSSRLTAVHELAEPKNSGLPDSLHFAVDSLNFSGRFNKRQKNSFRRIINNSFVVNQKGAAANKKIGGWAFDFFPNHLPKTAHTPAENTLNFDIIDDAATNKIIIRPRYIGKQQPHRLPGEVAIDRKNFLNGNYYEAAYKVSDMVESSIMMLYPSRFRRSIITQPQPPK